VPFEGSFALRNPAAASARRAAFRATVNAGTVAAILSLIPGLAILALPLAGFLCVLLYRRHSSTGDPSPGMGFRLGARAGALGSLIYVVCQAIVMRAHNMNEVRDILIEAAKRTSFMSSDQQVQRTIEFLKTPQGPVVYLILGAVMVSALFVILSGVGGAMAAALLRRKLPPQ
jgi:hypothetical protein